MPLKRTPPTGSSKSKCDTESDSNTPSYGRQTINISQRRKRKLEHVEELSDLKEYFRKLFTEFKEEHEKKYASLFNRFEEMNKSLANFCKTTEFISKQYDDLKEQFNILINEKKSLVSHTTMILDKIESAERHQKGASLELRNIPSLNTESKEDLFKIALNAGNALNVNITSSDIFDVFRTKPNSQGMKPLIIEFNSVITKERILQSFKKYNQIHKPDFFNSANLKIEGPSKQVYMSESLTAKTRHLFYLARDFAKTNNYNFCWTSRGFVYLKKKEGSQAIRVNSQDILTSLCTSK
ncbi:unnamed protein product [Colias eurytheme]|nr:unnamed protein product [Colias eurytheme]